MAQFALINLISKLNSMDKEAIVQHVLNNDLDILSSANLPLEILSQVNYSIPLDTPFFSIKTISNTILSLNNLSLMHIAAYADSLEVFVYLEKRGIPIDIFSGNSYLPIHYAVFHSSTEIFFYILGKKPDFTSNVYHLPKTLIALSIHSRSSIILQSLLSSGVPFTSSPQISDDPISLSIYLGAENLLKILLEEKSRLGIKSTAKESPLTLAISVGSEKAVELLLNAGEASCCYNKFNPLHAACIKRMVKSVSLLCKYSQFFEEAPNFDSSILKSQPVHWGCQSHSPEIMSLLLKRGINVNALDGQGRSGPAYLCDGPSEKDTIEILNMLLDEGLNLEIGGNQNSPATLGKECPKKTVLVEFTISSVTKQRNVVKWLLDHGANPYVLISTNDIHNERLIDYIMKRPDLYLPYIPLFQPYLHPTPASFLTKK